MGKPNNQDSYTKNAEGFSSVAVASKILFILLFTEI